MQPTGVPVMDEYYGPTGAFRGTETCDVAGYLWSQTVLLSVSGQARMADRAERAFLNAGPATVSRDFRTHVYFQSPDRVVDNSPPCPHGPAPRAARTSQRICRSLHGSLEPDCAKLCDAHVDGDVRQRSGGHVLWALQVSALAAEQVPVELTCKTEYPFNETIEVSVNLKQAATFPLSFRIPGWCATRNCA